MSYFTKLRHFALEKSSTAVFMKGSIVYRLCRQLFLRVIMVAEKIIMVITVFFNFSVA